MVGKRFGLGAAGGGAAMLCAASVAWACTYQPHIFGLTADAGRPGSVVTVSGQALSGQGQVELHWNSATGQLLAAASPDASGNYSVPITIPADATPSVYYVVAVSQGTGIARSAFEVTAPPTGTSTSGPGMAAVSSTDGWSTGFTQQSSSPARSLSVDTSDQGGTSPALAAGLGLLGGGALVLAGLGVAAVRRRRSGVRIV